MPTFLSPGVKSSIIDESKVVPVLGNSTAVFCGDFVKGDVNAYNLITSEDELIESYGKPTKANRNDWYQASNFLQYSNTLLICRAANINGKKTVTGAKLNQIGVTVTESKLAFTDDTLDLSNSNVIFVNKIPDDPQTDKIYIEVSDDVDTDDDNLTIDDVTEEVSETTVDYTKIKVSYPGKLSVGQVIQFGDIEERYLIIGISGNIISLDHAIPDDPDDSEYPVVNCDILSVEIAFNGSTEILSEEQMEEADFEKSTIYVGKNLRDKDLFQTNKQILNKDDFDIKFDSIAFSTPDAKIKIIAKNPGTWSKSLRVALGTPDVFAANDDDFDDHVYHYVAEGIAIDDLFEYAPTGTQVALVLYDETNEEVVETWLVDLTRGAKDANNNSTFAETVINDSSNYIYVKVNDNNTDACADYTLVYDTENDKYVGTTLQLRCSSDSEIQTDDLLDAYETFSNKELVQVDIVIANELDDGYSARQLTHRSNDSGRMDCICFIGARKNDLVGKKSQDCVSNLVKWRKTGSLNFNSRYCTAIASYKYMYDRYADEYFWCNIAGDCAGLRAQTNSNYDCWWASAGLNRGILQGVVKLAFNPTEAQRDVLYKNALNPVVTFPGQGTVLWGQKTLQSYASSFDRVNVVGLFNKIVRELEEMSRYSVMEFNDEYTRNSICSTFKPYLQTVKAGRGIDDYMVVCDTSNNTPDVISHNQLVVDIYIRPMYVAEYISLRFINAGTNDFSKIYS